MTEVQEMPQMPNIDHGIMRRSNTNIVFVHSTKNLSTSSKTNVITLDQINLSIKLEVKQKTEENVINTLNHACVECCSNNIQTRHFSPHTKQSGYYCDSCLQDVTIMDEIYKWQPDQFWRMYPEPSNEHNKTF
jgi:hypothetical protein